MCKRYRNLVEFFIDHGVMIGKTEFNITFYGLLVLLGVVIFLGL